MVINSNPLGASGGYAGATFVGAQQTAELVTQTFDGNLTGEFVLTPEIFQKIKFFSESFGLNNVFDFNNYLQQLIKSNLEGYDFLNLEDEEFKHVGGPIILSIVKH